MKLLTMLAVGALSVASLAQAQTPAPDMQAARDAVMKACATDSKSLCDGKTGRDMMMCLRTNTDKVSPGCKDALSKMPARGGGAPPAQ